MARACTRPVRTSRDFALVVQAWMVKEWALTNYVKRAFDSVWKCARHRIKDTIYTTTPFWSALTKRGENHENPSGGADQR